MVEDSWFKESVDYWQKCEVSVDGVLGGLGNLNTFDICDSRKFLDRFFSSKLKRPLCLDVGAGIGRVSEQLLLDYFEKCCVLESDTRYQEHCRKVLGDRLHRVYGMRMQEFTWNGEDYFDLLWIQWVAMYASDSNPTIMIMLYFLDELKILLTEAKQALSEGGLICFKENVLSGGEGKPYLDDEDRSLIRSASHFRAIFADAGFEIVGEALQRNFPKALYPVRMFMLRPIK